MRDNGTAEPPIGTVFNIQRFSVHDGPGVRTTVFLKGCALNCVWCHNPESKRSEPVLAYYASRCAACGRCAAVCPAECHKTDGASHTVERAACVRCGACAAACPNGALELIGRRVGVDEVMAEVLKDRAFYRKIGGMTLSGGDPLFQPDFSAALLRRAKAEGLHTCVETSGFAPYGQIERLLPYVDLFLYDWKETDDALHQRFTGVSNRLIAENLARLSDAGAKLVLRCPLIPGHNDRPEHYAGIAALAERLPGILRVELMPYHVLGSGKSEAIGERYPLGELPALSREAAQSCAEQIRRMTGKPVAVS